MPTRGPRDASPSIALGVHVILHLCTCHPRLPALANLQGRWKRQAFGCVNFVTSESINNAQSQHLWSAFPPSIPVFIFQKSLPSLPTLIHMILGPDFNFRNFHLLLLLLQTSSSAAAGRFESLSHLEHKQKDEREDESIERRCMLLKVGEQLEALRWREIHYSACHDVFEAHACGIIQLHFQVEFCLTSRNFSGGKWTNNKWNIEIFCRPRAWPALNWGRKVRKSVALRASRRRRVLPSASRPSVRLRREEREMSAHVWPQFLPVYVESV